MKIWIGIVLAVMLAGCGSAPVMETVADELVEPAQAPMARIYVELPDEAALPAMEGSESRLYLCEDHEILIQTLDGGDLEETLHTLTGYGSDKLTLIQTRQEGNLRYDLVWVSTGEAGEMLGRGVVIDDGNYHYAMTVLRPAADTENTQIVCRRVFESFSMA